MGGTFRISAEPKIDWFASTHVYGRILKRVARELDSNANFFESLSNAVEHFPHMDVTDLDGNSFMMLFKAALAAHQKSVAALNRETVSDYSISPQAELIVVMYLDPRCTSKLYESPVTVKIADDINWEKPGWVYELIRMDLLRSAIWTEQNRLISYLRDAGHQQALDLTALEPDELKTIGAAVKNIDLGYGRGVTNGTAQEFKSTLFPAADALSQLFKQTYPAYVSPLDVDWQD